MRKNRKLTVFLFTAILSLFCAFFASSCGNILNTLCEEENHEFIEKVIKEPTCGAEGLKNVTCKWCNLDRDEPIEPTNNHNYERISAKEATCEEDGYNSHRKCKVCGYESGKTVYKALGHDATHDDSKEASCQSPAYCGVCKKTYGKVTHTYTPAQGEAVTPTCTTVGWEKYEYCTVEGCTFTTKVEVLLGHDGYRDGQKELPFAEVEFIEKTTYINTCEDEAYCGICGESYIPAIIYGEHIKDKASCTEASNCDRCGLDYGEPKGHTWITIEKKDADCLKEGHESYTYCKVCEVFLVEKEIIPAKGHYLVDVEQKQAACTDYGMDLSKVAKATEGVQGDKVCLYCQLDSLNLAIEHKLQYEKLDAAGHEDCTNAGCKTYWNCITLPLGHDSERENYKLSDFEKEISVKPTCTQKGFCSICKSEYDELPHTKSKDSKCGERAKCSECGQYFGDILEHQYGTDGTCTVCSGKKPEEQAPSTEPTDETVE